MTFVTAGLAVAGLCAVALPIIIHLLFRRRRRPIEWAAMRFLIEAFRKHRRRLQLEQLLLLAVRCLILAVLGAALARPLLHETGLLPAGSARAVFLVIDNSMAASLRAGDRSALQESIETAVKVVEALGPGDAVGVVTASRPVTTLLVPPSTDHGAVIDLLRGLRATQSPADLPGALAAARQAAAEARRQHGRAVVYLLSEFRAGSVNLESPLPQGLMDLGEQVTLLSAPAAAAPITNIQVAGVEPVRSVVLAGEAEGLTQVTVRLARHGGELGREVSRVRLGAADLALLEPKIVEWEPGQTRAEVDFIVDFGADASPSGATAMTASIEGDALAADNERFAVIQVRDRIRAVMIDRRKFSAALAVDQMTAGQWMRRALAPYESSPIEVAEVDPAALDPRDLRAADAAILPRPDLLTDAGWQMLRQFVTAGGLVLVTPPSELNVHPWTQGMVSVLGLPWTIAMEPAQRDPGMSLAAEQPNSELLRLIASDLPDLARAVVVNRWLPVEASVESGSEESGPIAMSAASLGRADVSLALADGSPLLIVSSPSANVESGSASRAASEGADAAALGIVAYLATAPHLDWTSLPSQPLMVALMQELVRQGVSLVRASQRLQVGDRPVISLGRAAAWIRGNDEPPIALTADARATRALDRAGLYSVLDAANQPLGMIAVNVDPQAGRTQTHSQTAVTTWLARSGPWQLINAADPAAPLRTIRSGLQMAGALLAAVLALVVAETMLARWFSHATESAAARDGLRASPAVLSAATGGSIGGRSP